MPETVDGTMIMRVLQNLQTALAKIDLKLSDMNDKIDRTLDEHYIHRGQLGALRHDAGIMAERCRDLEIRVRTLEQPPDQTTP